MTELTPREILEATRRGLEETARRFTHARAHEMPRQPQPRQPSDSTDHDPAPAGMAWRARYGNFDWRARVDEDGHYCFAVVLSCGNHGALALISRQRFTFRARLAIIHCSRYPARGSVRRIRSKRTTFHSRPNSPGGSSCLDRSILMCWSLAAARAAS
jgi:hypothetical protein